MYIVENLGEFYFFIGSYNVDPGNGPDLSVWRIPSQFYIRNYVTKRKTKWKINYHLKGGKTIPK